jgi:glycosyltransferase involved in cell wall biosynthesis
MKILYLFDHFDVNRNYRDVSYAKEMAKKHEVYVLTSKEEEKESVKKWEGVTVIRKNAPMKVRGFVPWFNDYKKIIKKINPDVIHTFEGIKISTSIMGCWAKKQGYPVLYDQENRLKGGWGTLTRWKYKLGGRYFEKRIIKKADLIRVVTPGGKDYILREFKVNPKKIVSSTLGFDKKIFYYSKRLRKDFRKKIGIKKEQYLVLTTGSLVRLKKIEWLIDSFKKIKDSTIIFLIIGKLKQDYYNELISRCRNNPNIIIKNKFLDLRELNEAYNGADILLWPHVTISYFEALATQTPILIPYFSATKHLKGIKGLFFYGEDKIIFDKNERIINKEIRINEIAKIISSKPKVKKINAKKFSWQEIGKSLEKDYLKTIEISKQKEITNSNKKAYS